MKTGGDGEGPTGEAAAHSFAQVATHAAAARAVDPLVGFLETLTGAYLAALAATPAPLKDGTGAGNHRDISG